MNYFSKHLNNFSICLNVYFVFFNIVTFTTKLLPLFNRFKLINDSILGYYNIKTYIIH